MDTHGIGCWLASGHVGLSSSTLAAAILGYVNPDREPSYPHDSDDFSRCYRLWHLSSEPERSLGLERLAAISGPWFRLSQQWGSLLSSYATDQTTCHHAIRECIGQNAGGTYTIKRDENGRWDRFHNKTGKIRLSPTPTLAAEMKTGKQYEPS